MESAPDSTEGNSHYSSNSRVEAVSTEPASDSAENNSNSSNIKAMAVLDGPVAYEDSAENSNHSSVNEMAAPTVPVSDSAENSYSSFELTDPVAYEDPAEKNERSEVPLMDRSVSYKDSAVNNIHYSLGDEGVAVLSVPCEDSSWNNNHSVNEMAAPTEPVSDSAENRYSSNDEGVAVLTEPVPYEDFYRDFLLANRPCLIKSGCGVTADWNCRRDWVTTSDTPDLSFFLRLFESASPSLTVPVSVCGQRYFNAQRCRDMPLADYVEYFAKKVSDVADAAGNNSDAEDDDECLYLKDWHFTKDCPGYKAYDTPEYFKSDWLNEYYDALSIDGAANGASTSDYRFVYAGPAGSWTPLHHDVFGSFSWSANVTGVKRWTLFAPGQERFLKDQDGNLAYDVRDLDAGKYPDCDKVTRRYEIVQNSGDVVFVPSLWYHQVENVTAAVSVNHNWFNAANVATVWKVLLEALADVRKQMEDCRLEDHFEATCQTLLRDSHGMNVEDLFRILDVIARNRMSAPKTDDDDDDDWDWDTVVQSGVTQRDFDLEAIGKLVDCASDEFHAYISPLESLSNLKKKALP